MNPYRYVRELKKEEGTPAQVQIRNSLLKLLEEKPLEKVSVKELCERSYVARSTFYAYYENLDEVLKEMEDCLIYDLARQNDEIMDPSYKEPEETSFYRKTLDYVMGNRKTFYLFLVKRPDYRFIEKWKDAVKYHLWERLPAEKKEKNAQLILEMVSSMVISAYTYALKNSCEIDPAQLDNIVSQTLKMIDCTV